MKLLYEDKEIIVCEKPAGTASQNERGFTADMVSLLMTHEKESGVKQPYIGVVHRLDKMVGGVMVYAKNKSAAANLSKQIAQHKVKKKYYAVVMGIPETQNGVMEDYLVRDGRTNTSGIAGKNEKDAKPAKLEYRVLKTKEITSGGTDITCSLLEVNCSPADIIRSGCRWHHGDFRCTGTESTIRTEKYCRHTGTSGCTRICLVFRIRSQENGWNIRLLRRVESFWK